MVIRRARYMLSCGVRWIRRYFTFQSVRLAFIVSLAGHCCGMLYGYRIGGHFVYIEASMFTWEEKLKLAQQFAKRTSVKGISSIGTHKATFRTATGTESHDYFYLESMAKPELPVFLQQLIRSVFQWQAKV